MPFEVLPPRRSPGQVIKTPARTSVFEAVVTLLQVLDEMDSELLLGILGYCLEFWNSGLLLDIWVMGRLKLRKKGEVMPINGRIVELLGRSPPLPVGAAVVVVHRTVAPVAANG